MTNQKATILLFAIGCYTFSFCSRHSLVRHYADSVLDSALALGNQGEHDKAMALVNDHYASFSDISVLDRYRFYRFCYDLYFSYYSPCYDPNMALSYADSMIYVLKSNGLTEILPTEYAVASNLQGQVYVELKRYPEAFHAFGVSQMLAEKAGDTCMEAKYNSTMGTVRFRQGQYPEAIQFYKRSLGKENSCRTDATEYHDKQGTLANIALAYTKINQIDSALAYYKTAEEYIVQKRYQYTTDSTFPQIALAVVYGNEALAVIEAGDFTRAEILLKKAIAVNMLPGRDNNTGVIEKLHLSQLYLRLNRKADAFALLQETASQLPRDDDGTKKLWLTLMWKYNEEVRDDKKAISFLKATLALSDSMTIKDRYHYATNENNINQLVEARYTIDLLQKSNTIQQMTLIIAALLILMTGTLTYLIRKNLRRQKDLVTELTMKNQAIVKHEAQLEHLLAALDHKNKEKDRILQVVAHDLRSPIGGIKMMSGLLLGKDQAKQVEMIGFIRNGATHCLELVNELLEGGFNGEGVLLDKTVFDLKKLVMESTQLMQFNAAEKDQTITPTLPVQPQPLLADAGKLSRVLNNLIGNAIKFSSRGDNILVTLGKKEQHYIITIKDHGIGIPDANKHRVFEPLTVSRRPGTQGEKSFGFGLAIAKQIIEAHMGKIDFVSQEGQGTEFFIEIPLLS